MFRMHPKTFPRGEGAPSGHTGGGRGMRAEMPGGIAETVLQIMWISTGLCKYQIATVSPEVLIRLQNAPWCGGVLNPPSPRGKAWALPRRNSFYHFPQNHRLEYIHSDEIPGNKKCPLPFPPDLADNDMWKFMSAASSKFLLIIRRYHYGKHHAYHRLHAGKLGKGPC